MDEIDITNDYITLSEKALINMVNTVKDLMNDGGPITFKDGKFYQGEKELVMDNQAEQSVVIKMGTEAQANINNLIEMLSKVNEEIEKMKNGLVNFQPKDAITTNYNNCTFIYGKHGCASIYNGLVEKHECECDCDSPYDCGCDCSGCTPKDTDDEELPF